MRQPEINLAEHSEREKNTKWKNKHGKVESVYMGESTLNREYCKVTEPILVRPCLDCKFLKPGYCSTFRLYLTNFI